MLNFFKRNWALLLSLGLLIFIVLVPKIPLFEIIPGYIVRARIEDLMVALAVFIYLIALLRRKISLRSPVTGIFIFYIIIGIFSMLNAAFLVQTLPLNLLHLGKMFLHFARRLEYFSLFFLFYAVVKTKSHLKLVLFTLSIILLLVTLYGYGQKYFYWPVYSTMNREFSKGVRLVLTEHARVPSTFGGHYDMSAFVMIALLFSLATLFIARSYKAKLWSFITFISGFWLLILGSSRSSFLAYLLGAGLLVLLIAVYNRSLIWGITRGFVLLGFSLFVLVSFGDLSSRFSQLGFIKQINGQFAGLLKPVGQKPKDSIAIDNPVDITDQLPATPPPKVSLRPSASLIASASGSTSKKPLPPDVYVDIPDLKTITATIGGKTVTTVVEVPREFSPCTYEFGLSACIRFDTLWPRAINGFTRNPLLGSGYSTLTKSKKDEFTEAESTDNDFLRNAGETGALGVIGFYGPIGIFFIQAISRLRRPVTRPVAIFIFAMLASSLGLLFNGLYIDVFEASKVAFVYWGLLATAFVSLKL